jgi:unsaturated rhamnogalacturonyl hydrolase
LVLLHRATGESRWFDHLARLTAAQVGPAGELFGYDPEEFNIDNILAGRCLFHLDRETGDRRYMMAARRLAGQLSRHPRTRSGNYWHKAIYPSQVWLDGLYMGLPFQMEFAIATDDRALLRDALDQFETALAVTRRTDGLYAHGYDEDRRQYWADPMTGQNEALWARALGWLSMALVDAAELAPSREGAGLRTAIADLLPRLVRLAGPDGLWLQVPDRPDLGENYVETSASAMLAYAFLVASRLQLCPGAGQVGAGALERLAQERLRRDATMRLRLERICLVAGLGGNGPRRDGTAAYYLAELVGRDDVKGAGPLMMACAEHLRQKDRPIAGSDAESVISHGQSG